MNDPISPPPRRSAGSKLVSRALWYAAAGKIELRTASISPPSPDQALIRTLYSGVSRGTERLVFSGAVGKSEWERMTAPLQEGKFPFPVKYGYCAVGVVERGPKELAGKTVFCLHPHQDVFLAPIAMLTPIPDQVPPRRATLAANMETALNAVWDSAAAPADRVVVVGAGVVGLLIAFLSAQLPGAEVTVIDVAEERREIVESFGARFLAAPTAGMDPASVSAVTGLAADVVFHTSVSAAGLDTAIAAAAFEASIVELSWYGSKEVAVKLGGSFHSQRLKLISSQVGHVSATHRPRWNYRRRMQAALRLLDDVRLDALVSEEISFADATSALPRILSPGASGLAPVIRYPGS